MGTKEIVKEIRRLPLNKRLKIIEETLKAIREDEVKMKLEKAVATLQNDYRTDKELTAFTDIDFDNFYEAR